MILTHLMGGIGNQMFQYAAAKSLASRLSMEQTLYFEDHYDLANRNFALSVFNISCRQASDKELNEYLPSRGVKRRLKKLLGINYTGKLYREQHMFLLDKGFFNIDKEVFFSGFWQNYRYFKDVEEELREDFRFVTSPSGLNETTINKIQSTDTSVSVHVRRTDYINPKSGLYPLPLSYYERAIKKLESDLGKSPHYFFFSDDPEWVRETFGSMMGDRFSLIEHNDGQHGHEDLRLMSTCNHHIIANSSFSWWGAWLNSKPNKKVIAPEVWMKNHPEAREALFNSDNILIDVE